MEYDPQLARELRNLASARPRPPDWMIAPAFRIHPDAATESAQATAGSAEIVQDIAARLGVRL